MRILTIANTNNDIILITVILNNLDVVCRWLETQGWSKIKIEKLKEAMKNGNYDIAMSWIGEDLEKIIKYIQNIKD